MLCVHSRQVSKDLHTQIDAVPNPKMNFGDLLSSWFIGFTWWEKALMFIITIIIINNKHLTLLLPVLVLTKSLSVECCVFTVYSHILMGNSRWLLCPGTAATTFHKSLDRREY
jgi:hypothetical protein